MTFTHPFSRTVWTGLCLAALALPVAAQTSGGYPPDGLGGFGSGADTGMGAGTGLSMGGTPSPEVRSRVEAHMRAMQDLRMRMQTATTPEQRQSLMNEHLRLMDENMSLMQQMMMGSGGTPAGPGSPAMPGSSGSGAGSERPAAPGSVR